MRCRLLGGPLGGTLGRLLRGLPRRLRRGCLRRGKSRASRGREVVENSSEVVVRGLDVSRRWHVLPQRGKELRRNIVADAHGNNAIHETLEPNDLCGAIHILLTTVVLAAPDV